MSDNPLEDTPERDARIRERAYYLWEQDGCPRGQADEFWERARELIGMEESPASGLLPNPMTQSDPMPGVTVDEAALQENLGEFPSLMTDQGDRQQTPLARKAPTSGKASAASKTASSKSQGGETPASETGAKPRAKRAPATSR